MIIIHDFRNTVKIRKKNPKIAKIWYAQQFPPTSLFPFANRKKTQILPVPEVQKHLPKMLDNYRKSHVDKDAKPAEIKQLEAKVEQARIRSRNLDKEILLTHREKDKVELAIRNLEMEISQAETNCEGVRKQMKQIDANHKKELEEMTVTIERLELEKRGLEQELQNADHGRGVKNVETREKMVRKMKKNVDNVKKWEKFEKVWKMRKAEKKCEKRVVF